MSLLIAAIIGGVGAAAGWVFHAWASRSMRRQLDTADARVLELEIAGVTAEETIRRLTEAHAHHVDRLTRANALERQLRLEIEELNRRLAVNAAPGSAAALAAELRRKAEGGDPPR